MLYEVMRFCRNFFPSAEGVQGTWVISGGRIDLPFLKDGQYFFIESSSFNDGVYLYPSDDLTDETFDGWITPLAPPKEFLALVEEIKAWQAKYGSVDSENMSPYQSESFNGYSYSKGGSNNSGAGMSWQTAFRERLRLWRKI